MTSNEADKKTLPHQKFWILVEKKIFFPDFFFFFFDIDFLGVLILPASPGRLIYIYIY